jgi:hypothetical protein
VLAGAPDELARHRALGRRALGAANGLAERLPRAPEAPRRDAGEHLLEHDRSQRVAIGEVAIGPKRHLTRPLDRAHPGPLDRHPTSAERDLAGLVAVAHRRAVGVLLALRADDLVNWMGDHRLLRTSTDPRAAFTNDYLPGRGL